MTTVVLLLVAIPGFARTAVINGTTIVDNQLTIVGSGFTESPVSVSLNGERLTVVSNTPTQIVATLDQALSSGKYKVVVRAGHAMAASSFAVFTEAKLVADINLSGQVAALPPTQIMIPPADGTYRVRVTLTMVKPSPYAQEKEYWHTEIGSSSEPSGEQGSRFDSAGSLLVHATEGAAPSSSAIWLVNVHAGVPLAYRVAPNSPEAGGEYQLSISVEELK